MANKCDKFCHDCVYMGVAGNGYIPMCNYIFIEDKRRPCPPGEGCTVKLTDKEVKKKKAQKRKELSIEQKQRYAQKSKEWYEKKRASRKKLCRRCGKEFTPSVERHLFCSGECAAAQEAENRKKWDKEKWQKRKAAMKEAREAKGD